MRITHPPVHGRPTTALPVDKWRWLMAVNFDEETYGQRWQVETVMFMLKQHQGAGISACTNGIRQREMALMAITHNIMIVLTVVLFCRACQDLFILWKLLYPNYLSLGG